MFGVISEYGVATLLTSIRFLPILFVFPLFALGNLQNGILRAAVLMPLLLFCVPIVYTQTAGMNFAALSLGTYIVIISNEILHGLFLVLSAALPFWIASILGNIIDTQAGTQMASIVSPGSGDETTPYGNFFFVLCVMVFLELDMLPLLITDILAKSYLVWPIEMELYYITEEERSTLFRVIPRLFLAATVMSIPFIVIMLMIDISLGFISRMSPSISPFFLSLGLKQLSVLLILFAYWPFIIDHFMELIKDTSS